MRASKSLKVAVAKLEVVLREIEQGPEGSSVDRPAIRRAKRVFEQMKRGHAVDDAKLYEAVRAVSELLHDVYLDRDR